LIGNNENTTRPNWKWKKPIWWPQNLKYMLLHSQTRYQRNFKVYTYVFGDWLPIGTNENTMRPNRKCIKPIWRSQNLKCMFLHSQTRYRRNSKDYTNVFGIGLSIDTHENTMRPNRKWKVTIWWPLIPDKISTKFQSLYLCFRGPAFHWYPREYYATKPEVNKTNLVA